MQGSVNDLARAALAAPWERRFRIGVAGYLFDAVSAGIVADAAPAALLAVQLATASDPLDGALYGMAAVLHYRLGNCVDGDEARAMFKQWGNPPVEAVAKLAELRTVGCQRQENRQ